MSARVKAWGTGQCGAAGADDRRHQRRPGRAGSTAGACVSALASPSLALTQLEGLPPVIHLKHVMRRALTPVLTIIGLQIGYLFGGVIVIENLFAIPGMGRQLLIAAQQRDYPVLQALIVLFAAAFVLAVAVRFVAARHRPARAGMRIASASPWLLAGLLLTAALLAPPPFDPTAMDFDVVMTGPGWPHVMDTDNFGRDVFSAYCWPGGRRCCCRSRSPGSRR